MRRAWKKGAHGVVLGVPKTQRGRRALMLPDHVVAMLAPLAAGRPEDFLLASPTGRVIHRTNFVERRWNPALAAAGITRDLSPHSARPTLASWALMEGVAP